jgi:hypothetical protein
MSRRAVASGSVSAVDPVGYVIPAEHEQAHYATLTRLPQPAWEQRRTWGSSEGR